MAIKDRNINPKRQPSNGNANREWFLVGLAYKNGDMEEVVYHRK